MPTYYDRTDEPMPICGVKGCPDHPVPDLPAPDLPAHPLDLSPLLAFRDRAAEVEARLRTGDASAIDVAYELDATVTAAAAAFAGLVERLVDRPLDFYGLRRPDLDVLCGVIAGTWRLQPMAELLDQLRTYE